MVVKLKTNRVDPDDYWDATIIARVRKDWALYAGFSDDLVMSNLLRPDY